MSIYVSFTGSNQSNKGILQISLQPLADSQSWTLTALSGTTFSVYGTRSGSIGTLTVGIPFVHDDGTFDVDPGAQAFDLGDAFDFAIHGFVAPRYVKKVNGAWPVVNYPGGPAADVVNDGVWLVSRRMFENLPRIMDDEIAFGDTLDHFRNIIKSQDGFTGSSFGVNNYRKLELNLGYGGTIRDYSSNFQLLASNLMQSQMSPLTIISFAETEYARALSSVDQYMANELVQFIASNIPLNTASLPALPLLNPANAAVVELLANFEQQRADNQTLKEVYSDSTSPVANWPLTLPFMGIVAAAEPKLSYDAELGIDVIIHHDGHISPVATINSEFEKSLALTFATRSDSTKTQGTISLNAPPTPYARQLWYDSATQALKVFNVMFDTSETPTGSTGEYWFKRTTQTLYQWDDGVANWVVSGASIASRWMVVDTSLIRNNLIFAIETKLFDAVHPATVVKFDLSTFASSVDAEIELAKYSARYNYDMFAPDYVSGNAFTWNYSSATIVGVTAGIARWFDVYKDYFNQSGVTLPTSRPDLEPWKLLYYETKSAANAGLGINWDTLYADDTNTRLWKTSMWTMISAARPGLKLCVDPATDMLLPPYVSSSETYSANALLTVIPAGVSNAYVFGDNGPVELVWKKSLEFLYGMARVAFKQQPMTFLDKTWGYTYMTAVENGIRLERNLCAPLPPSKFLLHGERLNVITTVRAIAFSGGTRVVGANDAVKFVCSHVEDDATYFYVYVNDNLIGSITEGQPFTFTSGATSFVGVTLDDHGIPYNLGDTFAGTATTRSFTAAVSQKFLGFGQIFTNLLRHNYISSDVSEATNAYRGWTPRLSHRIGALIRGDSLRIGAASIETLPTTAYELILKRSTNSDSKWISGIRVQLVQQGTKVLNSFGNEIPYADGSDWQFRVEVYNQAHPTADYYTFDTNAEFMTFSVLDSSVTKLTFKHFTERTALISSAMPQTIVGIQNVVNFLFGYTDRLTDLGWTLNAGDRIITDDETGRNLDWQLEIEKFIAAVYRGMFTGNGHVLNPFMHGLWLNTPVGLMARYSDKAFIDADSMQAAYDVNGSVIPVNDLQVIRTDENTVTYSDTPIFSAHAFTDEYEHVILFNDKVSDETDSKTLYNPFLGLRIQQADVSYTRQEELDRKPRFNGFILVGNDVKRNITSSIDAVANYYDAHKTFNEPTTARHALALLGFNKKDYFNALGTSDATQFNFWRGLIQAKGTNMTIDAFANYKKFSEAGVDEYWAYKLAEYGDARRREYPELKIEVTDALQNFTQLQFFSTEDNAYVPLPLFTQIENNDDARWYSIDDLGKGLSFTADALEETLASLNVGYYELSNILHNGDDAEPTVWLRTTAIDGISTESVATTAEMVNATLLKVHTQFPVPSVQDGQVFFYEENQGADKLVGVLGNLNGEAFRFTTTNNPVSPDGNFIIQSNGQIKLTPVGARTPVVFEQDLFTASSIQRLLPKYFTVGGPTTMSYALVTNDDDLRVDYTSRTQNDACLVSFASVDILEHTRLQYQTKKDYRSMIWNFDIEVGSTSPLLNDGANWLAIVAEGRDNLGSPISYQIPIFQYCNNPASRSAHVAINFSTVKAGVLANIDTYMGDIDNIYFKVYTSSYSGSAINLAAPVQGYLALTNCNVTGSNSTITAHTGAVPAHDMGVNTRYDNVYSVSPERIFDNIIGLGYRGAINHNVGSTYFPEKIWNGIDRFEVVDALNTGGYNVVNVPATKWHADFAARANAADFKLIQSISYEMLSTHARYVWAQRDWANNFATTGSPAVYQISPCNVDAASWMKKAFVEFATIADDAGLEVNMRVGAPGWWINADDKPCVYDASARSKFNSETGYTAPDIGLAHSVQTNLVPHPQWRAFLKKEVGLSAQAMRNAVKIAFPSAQVGVLPDYPAIYDGGVMSDINLPSSHYTYPNFEFFQTEAYKWLISGTEVDLAKVPSAVNYPSTIGYPANKTHYVGGYAPSSYSMGDRLQVWKRIATSLQSNEVKLFDKQFIWSYSEIMRDGLTYLEGASIEGIQYAALRAFFCDGIYSQTYPNGANDFELIPNAFTYSVQAQGVDGHWSASSDFSIAISNVEEPGDPDGSRTYATYIVDVGPTSYEYVVKGFTWRNPTKLAPLKLFNYVDKTLIKEVGLWHPALGIHAYEALDVVNSISSNDPALYNTTIKTFNNPNYALIKPWGKREVGRVWWDTANLSYIPYYDAAIFPDRNERNARWGNLADWASLDLYEWIESDVPPEEYDVLALEEEGSSDIPAATRKSGKAAMKKYYEHERIISMRPIAWSYTPSGNAIAHPAFGTPVSQRAYIASSVIYIDATRATEAGLTEGRHFSAWKFNKPYGEAIVDAGIVYDLGSTTDLSIPFTIPSGFVDTMDVASVIDGRLGNFIGPISLESRLEQLDSSIYLQKLRMADSFGNYEDITVEDWLPESEDDRTFQFVDFGIQITITRTDSSVTYAAIDIVTDLVTSWSDVYVREGVRFTEILSLPDSIFNNDVTQPDADDYDFGWRAWDIPTQAQLDVDLIYPRNAWLPYLGDQIVVAPSPSVISDMKSDGLTLKNGISINRFNSTWTDWAEIDDVRVEKLSNGISSIYFDRSEFLEDDEELDTNRISIFSNGMQLSPKLYTISGEVGSEVIQIIDVVNEGTKVLFIYRAKQLTAAELAFDSSVEDDPEVQVEYKTSYQHTKVDVRSESGAITGAKYYFWVQDSTVVRPGKSISLVQAESVLKNGPSQFMLFAKIDTRTNEFDSCIVAGLNRYVTNNSTFKLRFTQDETLRDDPEDLKLKNVHTEWVLIKKTQNSKIPQQLWNKLTDAVAGADSGGNPLPSPNRVDYDARHGTRTSYGFDAGQLLAATDLVRATIKNTILNTSLEISVGDLVYPDKITVLNFDDEDEWFKDAESARATMNLIWSGARAKQINEIFFDVLEDALANNYELSDIFKTSMISVYSTSVVEHQVQSELQDGIF